MNTYLKKNFSKSIIIWIIIFFSICCVDISAVYATEETQTFTFSSHSSYWPTQEWKTSAPEEQGMDSGLLAEMFDEMNKVASTYRIHSLLIIRNGYIVVEAYYPGHSKDSLYKIYSSTKSVTSALFGIALHKGYISNLDQPVVDFFPEFALKDIDLKKQITLRHLLTMSSGLEWPETASSYMSLENPTRRMIASENWAKYVLEKGVKKQPGTEFNYNSGCAQLLAVIINKKTGDAQSFAEKNLFSPLGIADYYWFKDTTGIINGSHGLEMRTRDMAKFGYLYLKGGYWDGRQIIPRRWVEESTTAQIRKYGKPPAIGSPYYGYQWYIHPLYFHSLGYQGQYIFVIPEHEMVAVFTSRLVYRQYSFIPRLIERYIIPSAKETKPIPENAAMNDRLNAKIKKFSTGWWIK